MSKVAVIKKFEEKRMKETIPQFHIGDTIAVKTRIVEGDKERVQTFTGTVIARKGCGMSETFSLHRVAYGEGMERVFLLHSPRITNIEVVREGDVCRSKLYYLRGTSGKASKVKGRVVSRSKKASKKAAKEASQEAAPQEEVVENAALEVAEAPPKEETQ